jgi:hypothetical protein
MLHTSPPQTDSGTPQRRHPCVILIAMSYDQLTMGGPSCGLYPRPSHAVGAWVLPRAGAQKKAWRGRWLKSLKSAQSATRRKNKEEPQGYIRGH